MHGYDKARTANKKELCLSTLIISYGQKPNLLWIAVTKKGIKNMIYFEMFWFDCFDFLLNLLSWRETP